VHRGQDVDQSRFLHAPKGLAPASRSPAADDTHRVRDASRIAPGVAPHDVAVAALVLDTVTPEQIGVAWLTAVDL
jgi:hypothetical protein